VFRWLEQIGLVAQLSSEPSVPLTPRFEPSGDHVEQPRLVRRGILERCPIVEAGAERRVPPDVVAAAHLIFEKASEEQALRTGRLHHETVHQAGVEHKMIEDRTERRGAGISCSDSVEISA
jgi:hypothetical protein